LRIPVIPHGCHDIGATRRTLGTSDAARKTAGSAPLQIPADCLQQRLPLGERQAYVAGFGVRNISVQSRQFDPTQCGRIAIIELKNDSASHSASCSQDLRDKDNSIHAGVPAFLTARAARQASDFPITSYSRRPYVPIPGATA
jgi:hypothetical protein